MKTEKEIREDWNIEKSSKEKQFKKISKSQIENYENAIRTVRNMSIDQILIERDKLIESKKIVLLKWESYLKNFSAFRLKNKINHETAVRKEFKKVYQISKLNSKIKWIEYVIDKG